MILKYIPFVGEKVNTETYDRGVKDIQKESEFYKKLSEYNPEKASSKIRRRFIERHKKDITSNL